MPRKPKSPPHVTPSSPQPTARGAFDFRITLQGGVTPRYAKALESSLLDYLAARDLESSGTELQLTISSADRGLTLDDQVALLIWLVEDLVPGRVELGPVTPRSGIAAVQGEVPFVRVQLSDLTLIPIAWLYRAGRLDADQILKMLGGFTCTGSIH
jgi:hypothetical protein